MLIISTVRTRFALLTQDFKFKLGLVGRPERVNVAISRAKQLLLIFGCTELLQADPVWRQLMKAVNDRGGYVGPPLDCLQAPRTGGAADDAEMHLSSATQPAGSDEAPLEHEFEGEQHDMPWRADY